MRRLLPLLVVPLALAACGGGDSDPASPTKTLETLQAAAKDRDGDKVCSLFTRNGIENIEENRGGQKCAEQVKAGVLSQEESLEPHTNFEIGNVDQSSDQGTVDITFGGQPEEVEFKKEGDAWKIDESFP
jgi:hypothetical protein